MATASCGWSLQGIAPGAVDGGDDVSRANHPEGSWRGVTMGIDVPDLDDRTYEALLEEAMNRLPAYTDDWTDFNPSDPGVTILELLAYLTETHLYQLDRVTDAHREKFLHLVGARRRAPQSATVPLSLSLPAGAAAVTLPSGTELVATDESAGEVGFTTTRDSVLTDVALRTIVTEHPTGQTDHSHANRTAGMFYRPFGMEPAVGTAVYLGFDGNPFHGDAGLSMTVDYHDENLPEPATHGDEDPTFYPSVQLTWEHCIDRGNADGNEAWRPIQLRRDGTRSFYTGGTITLERPPDWQDAPSTEADPGILGANPDRWWIRCRVRSAGYEFPPQIDALRLNVVEAVNRARIEGEPLERVRAGDDPATLTAQRFRFAHAPVLEASIVVDEVPWDRVATFDASGPTDRHYVLDPSAGTIRFGDGVAGRMPSPTATVVARSYVHGGGEAGNVSRAASWRFRNDDRSLETGIRLEDIDVRAVERAQGGTREERLEEAFDRVLRDLRTPYRTVTVDDYRYVATHTPGLRFGRAAVRVDGPSADGGTDTVRVIIVPFVPADVPRPEPSEGFLDAVDRHLEAHRLLTDRVTVEPAEFIDLWIDVDIQTSQRYPRARVEEMIGNALSAYVDPLTGYEGEGWPFGRTLYRDDVVDVIDGVEVVDRVREIEIRASGNARVDGDQNVQIGESALLAIAKVGIDMMTTAGRTAGG